LKRKKAPVALSENSRTRSIGGDLTAKGER